jgi:hypothetical protein
MAAVFDVPSVMSAKVVLLFSQNGPSAGGMLAFEFPPGMPL